MRNVTVRKILKTVLIQSIEKHSIAKVRLSLSLRGYVNTNGPYSLVGNPQNKKA